MQSNDDKYFTQLDMDLQNLALSDWATFCKLVGSDAVLAAKIYMLKERGCSLQQIANRLDVTKETARYWVGKQPAKQSTKESA